MLFSPTGFSECLREWEDLEKDYQHIQEAWKYVLKCKPATRPNTGFLQQLSDWELHTMGTKLTDISGLLTA